MHAHTQTDSVTYISELVLLHGDPEDEFPLKLEEFIFCRHILICYVGKYCIIVLKTFIGSHWNILGMAWR